MQGLGCRLLQAKVRGSFLLERPVLPFSPYPFWLRSLSFRFLENAVFELEGFARGLRAVSLFLGVSGVSFGSQGLGLRKQDQVHRVRG